MTSPPESATELQARARACAGLTVGQLAAAMGEAVPVDLRRHKGWLGNLLERHLGATAGSQSGPDFAELGIELKTIPVRLDGRPVESTWVCTVSMDDVDDRWETSRVYAKLACVLWIPVESGPALSDRHLGMPLLWSPSLDEGAMLRRDWEEHMALIGSGRIDTITAHDGVVLQIRPKAANARVEGKGLDTDGSVRRTLPRGFYLRAGFTGSILARSYAL